MKNINIKHLSVAGLLVALIIILTRTLSIQTPIIRIGFSFIPIAILACLFSPFTAGLCGMIADLLGVMMFPPAQGFFPGFTISAFLSAAIYSKFFYQKELSYRRIITACITQMVLVDLFLNTLWVFMMTHINILGILSTRVISNLFLLVIKMIILSALLPRLMRELKRTLRFS